MWLFYQLLYGTALAVAAPYLLLRRGRHYWQTFPGRLGLGRPAGTASRSRPLWIHAVSVGEVTVARTLASALPQDLDLVVTTVTPTGQARARTLFGNRATVAYLPFDFGFSVKRFYCLHRPRALILVEGDYWPRLLHEARSVRLPAVVVNGRVGDRSYSRMRRLKRFLDPLLGGIYHFGVQSPQDRQRLLELGVPDARLTVTGNLKFDTREPPLSPALAEQIRALSGKRSILIAGSTMPGEEGLVLDAYAGISQAGAEERPLLILAPRHPERFDGVELTLRERGLSYLRRSALTGGATVSNPAVLLLDSLGELAGLYQVADAAFVGGTLVPAGGHNPIEAATFGVPVVVGPSMENFRDIGLRFDSAEAWRRISSSTELAQAWGQWLRDRKLARAVGRAAQSLVEENRGATTRSLELLRTVVPDLTCDQADHPS